MFASEKDEWKERDVEESGERKNWPDESATEEDERKVHWGSARVAAASRVF